MEPVDGWMENVVVDRHCGLASDAEAHCCTRRLYARHTRLPYCLDISATFSDVVACFGRPSQPETEMLHNQRLSIRVLPLECTPITYKMRELSNPSR